jgi:hypothetical protein
MPQIDPESKPIFHTFFSGENSEQNSAEIFRRKSVWGTLEISVKKV